MNRRDFIYSSAIPLLGTIMSGSSQSYGMISDPAGDFNPIVRRKLLKDPVIIESLNLYEKNGNWFIRVRSRDGAEGWSVGHPKKMKSFSCAKKTLKYFIPRKGNWLKCYQ